MLDLNAPRQFVLGILTMNMSQKLISALITLQATPERAVRRTTKCALWERAKEYNLLEAFEVCGEPCGTFVEEGFKAVNPKITFTLTKCPEWGDEYCEFLYEFKK